MLFLVTSHDLCTINNTFFFITDKLELIYELMVGGTVYQVREFNDKLLASVNSSVLIYRWVGECELEEECSYCNNILAIYLKNKGDFILVSE